MNEHMEENFASEPIEFPTVNKFLSEKSIALSLDYCESSALLATDVAKLLLTEGERPSIIALEGEDIYSKLGKRVWYHKVPLSPLRYNGRVTWGAHVVCELNGIIYDPMVGRPMEIGYYAKHAFDTLIFSRRIAGPDKIEEFVSR